MKCGTHSIEVTEDYTMFFVELDEQGRFYDPKQFQAIVNFLSDNKETDMSIVTFVHGWRHNAEYRDRNVQLARDTLIFTALGEAPKPHPNPSGEPRKVVGIYVGWRGLSNSAGANVRDDWSVADAWEVISVWDRKNTAQNVAVGSARELFSMLRAHQERANASVTPTE